MQNSFKPLKNYKDSDKLMQSILKSLSSDMVVLNKQDKQNNLEELILNLIQSQNQLIKFMLERDR